MNGPKAVRICIWGGIAVLLVGILIIFAGRVIAATVPQDPFTPPRGAEVALLSVITVVLGIGMTAAGAFMKAIGTGQKHR